MSPGSNPDDRCPQCGTPYGQRRRCYKCNPGGSPQAGEVRNCANCGREFYVPRWKLNDTARAQGSYCSRECKREGISRYPGIEPDESVRCTSCEAAKPASEFGPDRRKKNGKKSACKACEREVVNRWRRANPEAYEALKRLPKTERQKLRRRERDLHEKYGLTLPGYEQLLADHGGVCAICGNPPSGNGRSGASLHLDHDHACCPEGRSCGKCIRGLLCGSCNTMIGLAGDDPDRLLAAARYLQEATKT